MELGIQERYCWLDSAHDYSPPVLHLPVRYDINLTATNTLGSDSEIRTGYITVTVPPSIAGFSAISTNGTIPLNVSFSDASTGVITSYLWNFGDTATSTLRNPSHNYTASSTYKVELTASNSGSLNRFFMTFLKELISESDEEPDTILHGFGVLQDSVTTKMMSIALLPCTVALHHFL